MTFSRDHRGLDGADRSRRRTLVVRLDSLGDLVLCGPAIRAIARSSTVTLLCGRRGEPVARLLPGVDEVIVFRAPWIADDRPQVDVPAVHELVDRLAAGRFDDAVILTSARQSCLPTALVLRLAGIKRVVGLSVDSPGTLLDEVIRVDLEVHEVERSLAIAALDGHLPAPGDVALRVDAGPLDPAIEVLLPERFVVVHPGATVPARTLSAPRWREVAEALLLAGHAVVATGSAAETAPLGDLPVVDLGGRTTVGDLVRVLERADVVCVGNTGAMHLAAAAATPVCAIFAPTVPLGRWRPWQVPHVVLGDQHIECAWCASRCCPIPGQPCLEPATAAAVVSAVAQLSRHPSLQLDRLSCS